MRRFEYMTKEFPYMLPDKTAAEYAKHDAEEEARHEAEFKEALKRHEQYVKERAKKKKIDQGPEPVAPVKRELRRKHDYISQSDFVKELNLLGSGGWELSSIMPCGSMFGPVVMSATFKREITP